MDGDSPPDTLPRRSQLPSSQSFTNLTSIQPAPKGRLISSVSNTSLNSNGTFKLIRRRKKKEFQVANSIDSLVFCPRMLSQKANRSASTPKSSDNEGRKNEVINFTHFDRRREEKWYQFHD